MNPRPIKNPGQFARFAAITLTLLISLPAIGQEAPPPDSTSTPPADENVVVLSPFVVSTERDQGYFAENTLAGSRMRTNIADLASSITVVTVQQFEDTASVDLNDIFRYEANTEGSLTYTPAVQSLRNDGIIDVNAGFTHGANGNPQTNAVANRIRGLGIPTTSINFYQSVSQVPVDAYNMQSLEISRGPNSMLFGMGSPAGVVNVTTSSAVLDRDSATVSLRYDSNESQRASLSFNKGIIDGKLAVMGAFVWDDRQFERKPSYDRTKRAYGAITFQPFKSTVIRAHVEAYKNDNRRPNTLTPRDSVSEWRSAGSPAYDPTTGLIYITATGEVKGPLATHTGSPRVADTRAYIMSLPNYDPSLHGTGNWTSYNGVSIVGGGALTNVASPLYTPGLTLTNASRPVMRIDSGVTQSFYFADPFRYRQVFGATGNAPQYPTEAAVFADPEWARAYEQSHTASNFWTATGNGVAGGVYRYPGVTDKSIYDWTKFNTLQMNFGQDENMQYNIELEQRLLDDLFLNAGFFRQDFDSITHYTVSQLNVATLFVDTNLKLPDGQINPYFGQPYVLDFDPDRFVNRAMNDNYRAMLAWTPDFTNNEGWTKWLGRHQVLGLWSRNETMRTLNRQRWFHTESEEAANGTILFQPNPNVAGWRYEQGRSIQRWYYLANPGTQPYGTVTKASGVNQNPDSFTGNLRFYNYDMRGWDELTMTGEYIDHSAHTGRTYTQVDTLNFGITSNFWNDRLITTFGVRKDEWKGRSTTTGAIQDEEGNEIEPTLTNPATLLWETPFFPAERIFNRWNRWFRDEGTTRTAGAVLRPFSNRASIDRQAAEGSRWHQFISSLGFSYNKSDNFNVPPSPQVDAFGTPLPKPTGEGEDWGVQFSLFENKLFARVNWYKASNLNERTEPGTSISRLTNNVDTSIFRNWARTIAKINLGMDPTAANFNETLPAAIEDQVQDAASAIWQLPYNYYGDIGSIGATRTAESEGMEVQITYNPTRSWTMKFTGGKQDTKYANVLSEFDEWLAVRQPVWAAARAADYLNANGQQYLMYTTSGGREVDLTNFLSSYGYVNEVRLDEPNGLFNVQTYYDNIVAPQATIARDLDGQSSPGQRKYRWSYLTNYTFTEGRLQGISVGGSLRWEDKAVIGYFGRPNPDTTSTELSLSDVSRPIYDDANTYTDLWVGYTRKIWDNKVTMKLQLNVVNAFENGGLRIVGVNLDGSPNSYRIVEPRQFVLTAKFDF